MARPIPRSTLIAALETILDALRAQEAPRGPTVVGPTSSIAGRACPVHLREMIYRNRAWRCPVQGCPTTVEGPPPLTPWDSERFPGAGRGIT